MLCIVFCLLRDWIGEWKKQIINLIKIAFSLANEMQEESNNPLFSANGKACTTSI